MKTLKEDGGYISVSADDVQLLGLRDAILYSILKDRFSCKKLFTARDIINYLQMEPTDPWDNPYVDIPLSLSVISNTIGTRLDFCGSDDMGDFMSYRYAWISEMNIIDKKEHKSSTNIYVIIDDHTGMYKIGRSLSPVKRERTLLSQAPMIRLLISYTGTIQDELVLHERFKDKRGRGEWFNLDSDDLDDIYFYFKNKY